MPFKLIMGTIFAVSLFAAPANSAQTSGEMGDARSELKDSSGRTVGTVTLTDTPNGALIRVISSGLPTGTHAMHLHATGRCDAPSFESAGGHLNPTKMAHGYLDPKGPHSGDLPNIHVLTDDFRTEVFVEGVRLRSGSAALLDQDGAALVIHAGEDDYSSEPAGDAGKRIACAVISE